MADEQIPSNNEAIATTMRLMQVHTGLTRTIVETAGCAAGGLIQLRSHERGLEKHDDITLQLKTDLLAMIRSIYLQFSTQLKQPIDAGDHKALKGLLDGMLESKYDYKLNTLLHGYIKAFPSSQMAQQVLQAMAHNLIIHTNNVARWSVALLAMANYAHCTKAITNPVNELASTVGDTIVETHDMALESVDAILDKANASLDSLAAAENKIFAHLIAEGLEPVTAFENASKRFEKRIHKALYPEKT